MNVSLNNDLLRLVPDGATHCLVEERFSRGQSVWAVVAIVPDGLSLPLNAYSSEELAMGTAEALNLALRG